MGGWRIERRERERDAHARARTHTRTQTRTHQHASTHTHTHTQVLAAQHFRNVQARFGCIGLRVALLSRYTPLKEKKAIFAQSEAGELDIIVGTHALLTPKMQFCDLGLVVVDEEQRFGVNQKEKLKALAVSPDTKHSPHTPNPTPKPPKPKS